MLKGREMEYSQKLKNIREKLHLTQEDLARKLDVTVVTVNRWETGAFKPSRLAKKAIDDFCIANNLEK